MTSLQDQKSILIVDDEPDICEMLRFEFEELGYFVQTANCGEEAIALLKAQRANMIITDMRMPKGDGLYLLQSVRKIYGPFPPIIFMSGFSDVPLWEAYENGAQGWFGKPFSMEMVETVINRLTVKDETRWTNLTNAQPEQNIELSFNNMADYKNRVLLGRGGFFIDELFPQINKDRLFSFKFTSQQDHRSILAGTAMIRWFRPENRSLKKGTGIEFITLEEPFRSEMLHQVKNLDILAYIPMGRAEGNK